MTIPSLTDYLCENSSEPLTERTTEIRLWYNVNTGEALDTKGKDHFGFAADNASLFGVEHINVDDADVDEDGEMIPPDDRLMSTAFANGWVRINMNGWGLPIICTDHPRKAQKALRWLGDRLEDRSEVMIELYAEGRCQSKTLRGEEVYQFAKDGRLYEAAARGPEDYFAAGVVGDARVCVIEASDLRTLWETCVRAVDHVDEVRWHIPERGFGTLLGDEISQFIMVPELDIPATPFKLRRSLKENAGSPVIINAIKQLFAQYIGTTNLNNFFGKHRWVNLPEMMGRNAKGGSTVIRRQRVVMQVSQEVVDFIHRFTGRIEDTGWFVSEITPKDNGFDLVLDATPNFDVMGTLYYPVPSEQLNEIRQSGIQPEGTPGKILLGRTPAAARLIALRKVTQGEWSGDIAIIEVNTKKAHVKFYQHPDFANCMFAYQPIFTGALRHSRKNDLKL